jgi:hypothetical protein
VNLKSIWDFSQQLDSECFQTNLFIILKYVLKTNIFKNLSNFVYKVTAIVFNAFSANDIKYSRIRNDECNGYKIYISIMEKTLYSEQDINWL